MVGIRVCMSNEINSFINMHGVKEFIENDDIK